MEILSRAEWGATAPKAASKLTNFADGWFVHWEGPFIPTADDGLSAEKALMRSIQAYHKRPVEQGGKGWSDFAYSFGIGQTGTVFEGRGWGIAGAHTQGHNNTSMGIVFLIGEGQTPSAAALRSARELIVQGHRLGYLTDKVRPHNAVRATACPGPDLTTWARQVTIDDRVPAAVDSGDPEYQAALALQQYLRDAPEGPWFGTSGPAGDGVDGKFGPLTSHAVMWLAEDRKVRIRLLEDQLLAAQSGIDLTEVREAISECMATVNLLLDDIEGQDHP